MDLQEAFDAGFEAVKIYVERSFDAFEARLLEVEKRAAVAGPAGMDGSAGPPGEPGRDGIDGKDGAPGADGVDGKNGSDGKDGADGSSVSHEECISLIEELVKREVAKIELPKGEKGEPGQPGNDGAPGERGEKGEAGKDGADVTDAVIDRDGNLLVMLSNGLTKNVGPVVGRDGSAGRDGIDGKDGAAGVDGVHGKDGSPGRDGIDGLNFEDCDIVEDDAGLLVFRFMRGDVVKDVPLPIQPYAGQWIAGSYVKSRSVTHQGSLWIAVRDTDGRPGDKDSGWVLAVKRGRDGRESIPVAREKDKPVNI